MGVIEGCAEPGEGRMSTWITPELGEAYLELHHAGHAHSVEVWREGRLVGGLYGVVVGGLFAGESMFSRESSASKVALAAGSSSTWCRGASSSSIPRPRRST